MPTPARLAALHDRFRNALAHRYFIRLHMAALMTLVAVSGALAAAALYRAGLTNMGVRYPLVVAVSYAAFFGLVRLWIAYVTRAHRHAEARSSGSKSSLD